MPCLIWELCMEELKRFLSGRVVLKVGDITKEDADAIVNAANGF